MGYFTATDGDLWIVQWNFTDSLVHWEFANKFVHFPARIMGYIKYPNLSQYISTNIPTWGYYFGDLG